MANGKKKKQQSYIPEPIIWKQSEYLTKLDGTKVPNPFWGDNTPQRPPPPLPNAPFGYDMDAAARDWVSKYPNVPPLGLSDDPLPADTKTIMKNMDVQPPSAQTIEAQLAQGTDPFFGQGQPTVGKTAPTIPDTSALSMNNGGSDFLDTSGVLGSQYQVPPTRPYPTTPGEEMQRYYGNQHPQTLPTAPQYPAGTGAAGGDIYNPDQVAQDTSYAEAYRGDLGKMGMGTKVSDYTTPAAERERYYGGKPIAYEGEAGGDYYNPDQVGQSLPAPAATSGPTDAYFPGGELYGATAGDKSLLPNQGQVASLPGIQDESAVTKPTIAPALGYRTTDPYNEYYEMMGGESDAHVKAWQDYASKDAELRAGEIDRQRAASYSELDEGGGYGTGMTPGEITAANKINVPAMPAYGEEGGASGEIDPYFQGGDKFGKDAHEIYKGRVEGAAADGGLYPSATGSMNEFLTQQGSFLPSTKAWEERFKQADDVEMTDEERYKEVVRARERASGNWEEIQIDYWKAEKDKETAKIQAQIDNKDVAVVDENGKILSNAPTGDGSPTEAEKYLANKKVADTQETEKGRAEALKKSQAAKAGGDGKEPPSQLPPQVKAAASVVGNNAASPNGIGVSKTFANSGGVGDNGMYYMDEATGQKVLSVSGMQTMVARYQNALNQPVGSAGFLKDVMKEKAVPISLAPGYTWGEREGIMDVFWSPETAQTGMDMGEPVIGIGRLGPEQEVEYIAAAREMMQLKKTLQETANAKLTQDLKIDFGKMDADLQNTILTNSIKYQDEQAYLQTEQSFKQAALTGIFGEGDEATNTLERESVEAKLSGMLGNVPTLERDQITSAIMGKFRNPVTGEYQKTIQAREMEAAITGIWKDADGSDSGIKTIMTRQLEESKRKQRQDTFRAAGKVITDWTEGEPTVDANGNLVNGLDTLEKQALDLQKQAEQARITGKMFITDKNGVEVPTDTIEARRLAIEQEQADMTRAATEAKALTDSTGFIHKVTKGDDGVWRYERTAESALAKKMQTRDIDAQQEMLETQGEQAIAQINKQKMADAQLYSSNLQAQADLARTEAEFYAIKPGQNVEQSKTLANSFVTNINSAMKNAADSGDYEGVSAALGSSLPPTPSGLRWDGATGSFMQRAGFEGREMDFETQQWMAAVAPAFKARDRAEQATQHATGLKTEALVARQAREQADYDFQQAMLTADIDSAEEAIARQKMAETAQIETETKLQNMQMLFSLLQNPVQLGMAKRHGLLGQLESQLGFTLSNVPDAPAGAGVPNANEWQTMDSEQQAFRMASFVEGGGNATEFMQMIAGSAPAQMQRTQYATL